MTLLGVLPYWQVGPWDIGPLTLHSFGLAVVIGLFLGLYLAGKRLEKIKGIAPERVHNFGFWCIVFGWSFSHIFEVVTYQPHMILEDPLILIRVWGSISSVGGVLGGVIAYLLWCKWNPDEDHLAWGNLGAWTLPFCFFFGRVGCALVHDHPGQDATEFGPWNWLYEVTGGAVPEVFPLALEWHDGVIRHDLGFYEAIYWFFLAVLFYWMGQKPRRRGLYLWLLPLLYAPVRFFLDFLRVQPGDPLSYGDDVRYLGLTPAQYTVIGFFILGVILWYRWRNNPVEKWVIHEDPDRAVADGEGDDKPKKSKKKGKKGKKS